MALINIPTDHIKLRKTLSIEKKPLMLKDYLRNDLGSCSSSGFKSFPRRQCCTTIRLLLEADLKNSRDNYSTATQRLLKRCRSKPSSSAKSALQRASEAVLNAVKILSFPSVNSSSPSSLQSDSSRKGRNLPRSFSEKLFKRSFWRKADKEDNGGQNRRWRLFREFLQEKNQPSDQNNITGYTTTDTSSTCFTSRSSYSCAESEFTVNNLQCSSGNSKSLSLDDAVLSERNLPEKKNVDNMVGVTAGEDSINSTKEEGNEQLSPVSVLDCPFDDEEEENGSVSEDRLARVEGTKQKLMQKIRRFERLAQLEPVDLEAMAELEDDESLVSEIPSNSFVLLKNEMMKNPRSVEWEVNEGVKAYVNEMEKNENWFEFNEEKEEVGSLLEVELFTSLVDELLMDLFSQ